MMMMMYMRPRDVPPAVNRNELLDIASVSRGPGPVVKLPWITPGLAWGVDRGGTHLPPSHTLHLLPDDLPRLREVIYVRQQPSPPWVLSLEKPRVVTLGGY